VAERSASRNRCIADALDGFTYLDDPEPEQPERVLLPDTDDTVSPFFRRLENLEAWIAAFSGTLLSLFFVCMLLLPNQLAIAMPIGAYLLLVFGLGAVLEGPFLFRLWASTFSRQRPIGPAVARRAFTGNVLLRMLAAAWWFGHLAMAMMFIVLGEVQLLKVKGNIAPVILASLMLFGMSVCCNVFIALFVKAVFRTDSAVETFWRWRLLVDISLTGVALAVATRI